MVVRDGVLVDFHRRCAVHRPEGPVSHVERTRRLRGPICPRPGVLPRRASTVRGVVVAEYVDASKGGGRVGSIVFKEFDRVVAVHVQQRSPGLNMQFEARRTQPHYRAFPILRDEDVCARFDRAARQLESSLLPLEARPARQARAAAQVVRDHQRVHRKVGNGPGRAQMDAVARVRAMTVG
eukprot:5142048-Prymnesium_polylepis.2